MESKANHRARMQRVRDARKARGLCVQCGEAAKGQYRCAMCRATHKDYVALSRLRTAGLLPRTREAEA